MPDSTRLNILIVEDDTIDRISVERHLKDTMRGCRCVVVDTVDLARLAIRMESFDVIISDYKLHDSTGFDVLALQPDAPVIFITGKGDEETAVKALNSGAYDYLVKDKDSRFLKVMPKTIQNAVQRYRAEQIAHSVQFEESIAGVFTLNLKGHLVDCNRAFASVLGYISVNEIKAVGQAGNACCDIRFVKDVVAKGFVRQTRACFFGKNDERVFGLVNARLATEDADGSEVITGSMLDLTEHLKVEERKNLLESQLQTMQKLEALGTLAGGIAHDFNNLLGTIQGYSELALVEAENIPAVSEHVEEVLDACRHAKNLVRQIISFGQCRDPNQQPILLQQLVGEHINLLNPTLPPGVKISFKNYLEGELSSGPIVGDPVQLTQVFINLCTNSMHAMKDVGDQLTIEIRDVGLRDTFYERHVANKGQRYFCLSVRDNGSGMTEETRKKIFEPFFTTKSVGEGTGMGLAVVFGIVRSHKGIIEVDSVPQKGTEFRVYLPRAEHEAVKPAPVVRKSSADRKQGDGEEIILLDDDPASLCIMGKLLARLNYQVKDFQTPQDAMDYALSEAAKKTSLFISDFKMPQMSGIEVVRGLRRANSRMPFVIYTGYDQSINSDELSLLDVKAVLLKPVGLRELSEVIPAMLSAQSAPE